MKKYLVLTIVTLLFAGQSELKAQVNKYLNPNLSYGSVIDIDGNKYATIQIGNQTWMAENLNTTKYNDGTSISLVADNAEWSNLTSGAYSEHKHSSESEVDYGKLYNWYAVNTGKLCPKGWHIPTNEDWNQLDAEFKLSGIHLKSTGNNTDRTGLWQSTDSTEICNIYTKESPEGNNESGFSGLPGGCRTNSGGYSKQGYRGYWWSSTTSIGIFSWAYILAYEDCNLKKYNHYQKDGLSCRCVKD